MNLLPWPHLCQTTLDLRVGMLTILLATKFVMLRRALLLIPRQTRELDRDNGHNPA